MSANPILSDQLYGQITVNVREENLRKNLSRIQDRYQVSEEKIQFWKNQVARNEFSEEEVSSVRQAHLSAIEPVLKETSQSCRGPIILEGVNPPWLFEALVNAPTPLGHPSFRQRLLILQADVIEFLDGLSMNDFGDALEDHRLEFFIGDNAESRLMEWASQRIDDAPPAIVIQNPLLKHKASPDAHEIMKKIDSLWTNNESELESEIQSRPIRDSRWWVTRYKSALNGDAPLRVLIPVSRYTTYLKYAAADAAQAFEKIGCQTQILIEADDSAMMSKCNGLRAAIDFDPDLILASNYTRSSLSSSFPKDIPHVCWIQDAMEHLFDKKTSSSVSELDMFVGLISNSMIEDFDFPKSQSLWMPMAALQSKFATVSRSNIFESEIAWVTHQSESTDQMKQRLIQEMHLRAPNAVEPFSLVLDQVEQLILENSETSINKGIFKRIDENFFPSGIPESASGLRNNLYHVLVHPFAERVYRHQTVKWAANIARRRGWRFKLYGNNWENHPEFAQYASGSIRHDSQLPDCYRGSVIHLHASLGQMMHQRVSECILSGGLPLCRVTFDSFGLMTLQFIAEFVKQLDSGSLREGAKEIDGIWHVPFEHFSGAPELLNELVRFGYRNQSHIDEGVYKWNSDHIKYGRTMLDSPNLSVAANMFATISELGFDDEPQLESLIHRAIDDPGWRDSRVEKSISDLPKELTIEGFVENVIEFVQTRLEVLAQ
ncbi:MAG: hypothetical protein P1U42_09825 [Phycisphaerales bacterium]|nr:hypothetical protein [Phycisphaerales bacterium]